MVQQKLIQAERFESLKAGAIGAIATSLTFLLCVGLHFGLSQKLGPLPGSLPTTLISTLSFVSGLGAAIAGFLFGTTYRYIIRQDDNAHLKSGAVLAFGLVRGLALMDLGLALQATPWTILLLTSESLLMMAIARWTLDAAMERGWLKRFAN